FLADGPWGRQFQSSIRSTPQLNLPDTPIRDLVVKDSDVVLGTHGRGFWILDDIEPLRQMSAGLYHQPLTLFKPQRAVRGVERALVQYFLNAEVEKVEVDVLDAEDREKLFLFTPRHAREGGRQTPPGGEEALDDRNPAPISRQWH
ncbi:MAG: hypothetical protein ACE5JX_18210, partial [Acidobacteriota bacterium]